MGIDVRAGFWFAALLVACGSEEPPPLAEAYPGDWQQGFEIRISRTLAANNVFGCGQYEYRRGTTRDSFLVRCTGDAQRWTLYRVWPDRLEVRGPISSDGSI